MKKIFTLIAIILLIPFIISQKPPKNGDKPYVDGEIMIKLRPGQSQAQNEQMMQSFLADFSHIRLEPVQKLSERLNIFLLRFNADAISDDLVLNAVRSHPSIELAQFNHFIEQRELIPNDQNFNLQWNLHNTGQTGGTEDADIDGPEAWEISTSGITATGDTIVIAIVDDGFDIDHEDLVFWKNYLEIPNNGIDDDQNGYIDDYDGWNAWTNSGNIIERDHGTHVSGIAGAQGNNEKGVASINWNIKIMPIVGLATVESIVVAAYSYVHEMRARYNESGGTEGSFVVSTNASFGVDMGQPENFPIWGAMYDSLGMLGILSAGATANVSWNIDEVGDIPTAFPSEFLISVTNTDNHDNLNSGAGYGLTTIDLGAPGTVVYSTRQTNGYGYKTGTSMASPHVAGAVGFMYSVAGEDFMQAYHNDPAGMALVIKQYILNGTDPVPTLLGKSVTGGRLNIYKAALQMISPAMDFNPMSIFQVQAPDNLDSVSLSFTNNSGVTLDYSVSYPDTLTWISLTGATGGSIDAGSTQIAMVHFDTEGLTGDTLFTYLTFTYGMESSFLVPVHLVVDPFVAVPEPESMRAERYGRIEIWPNPAKEIIRISFNSRQSTVGSRQSSSFKQSGDFKLVINDMSGKHYLTLGWPETQQELLIDVSMIRPGIYYAVLLNKSSSIAFKKFIVIH